MSLADKVIKNTFYYILFQLFGFVFPLILTPFIISKIGEVQFGLYALVLGFIGIFSLFDVSISSSFIVFISKYFVKKDFENLNRYINTGFFFYIFFSAIIVAAGYLLSGPILSFIKIPPELFTVSQNVFYLGMIIFFISNAFAVFTSVLITLQKMYITSLIGLLTGVINLTGTFIVLEKGYGLTGIMLVQLATAVTANVLYVIYAKKSLPEIRIGLRFIGRNSAKEMTKFGSQMQISKLASFASEKYDEFLLAYFSVLNNVTYFNVANKISRTGRMIPFQIIPQVAPVASELNASSGKEKLPGLFSDVTKYLTLVAFPVFFFLIIFSDLLITTWMGKGFEISSGLLKILAAGQLINMILSAPGNSITPNIGLPKFQMYEGLIYLGINLVLSFILIKNYGILGAAIGNSLSVLVSSFYVFYVSSGFFSVNRTDIIKQIMLKPFIAALFSGLITALIYFVSTKYFFEFAGRLSGFVYIISLTIVFSIIYGLSLFKMHYLNLKDKILLSKGLMKLIPSKFFNGGKNISGNENLNYADELISIFIVTHSRLEMLRKCVQSILPTIEKINYELIIIDNASTDGTAQYLMEIEKINNRIRIISNERNIGVNSKSMGAEQSKGEYIVGVDDDVIMFPDNWVQEMVKAFKVIPNLGYLASDVIQDETTTGAKHPIGMYIKELYDDGRTILEVGPTGGWCFMISRNVYDKIGKLVTFEDRIFYSEDGDYLNRILNKGFKYGILAGVKVYHATGEFHNKNYLNVFKNKYKDFEKGNPKGYELKIGILRWFNLNRLVLKLQEYSNKSFD